MPKLKAAPETIAQYSDALRQRLAGTLPPEKIEEVVAETQAHLEDSAAELRYQPDIYERQAISQFVPVSKLSQGISRAWAPTFLRHSGTKPLQFVSATMSVLGILWLLGGMVAHTKLPLWLVPYPFPLELLLLVPAIVFVLAFLACRPQLRRFAWGGVATIAAFFLVGGWLCTENGAFLSRFDVSEHYKDTRAAYDFRNEEIRLLRQGLLAFYPHYTPPEWRYLAGKDVATKARAREDWQRRFNRPDTASERANLQRQLSMWEEITARQSHEGRRETPELEFYGRLKQIARTRLKELEKLPVLTPANRRPQQLAMLPAELRRGDDTVLVPVAVPAQDMYLLQKPQEITAFHTSRISAVVPTRTETIQRTQIALVRQAPEKVSANLDEAKGLWKGYGIYWLRQQESAQVQTKQELNRLVAFMAEPRGRFELHAAQSLGNRGAVAAGSLIVADSLGGYLGMALLRLSRRRRTRRVGLGV